MVERLVVTEEKWEELLKAHPAPAELVKVEGLQPGDIVLRNPTGAEHQAFNATYWGAEGELGKPAAYNNALVMQCVFPDRAVLLTWLKRWPALPTHNRVIRALMYLSGQIDSLESKG